MSLTGIREMTTILTPPEERHPILTFVGAYDPRQIGAAIRRELLRDGQVFYVHNRVESINRAAARLAEIVPEARIAVAHGQMPEAALEQVMIGFWEKAYDVLVCTTIVESGLDIPNANTLIVERADMFGLAQLHQLRGRVGRGAERAYCVLVSDAADSARLAAMVETKKKDGTDVPLDGFDLAMRDLQIRGAGEFLGIRQSGAPELRIVDLADVDPRLIDETAYEADAILREDPELRSAKHGLLSDAVDLLWRRYALA
jgi:transcription-repair coupling factor (superfamily II helicase)